MQDQKQQQGNGAANPRFLMPIRRETVRPHRPGTMPLIDVNDTWQATHLEIENYLLRLGANADELRAFANARDAIQDCVERCCAVFNSSLETDSGNAEVERLKAIAKKMSDMAVEAAVMANARQPGAAGTPVPTAQAEPAKTAQTPAPSAATEADPLADAEIPGEGGKVIATITSRRAEPPKRGGKAGVPKALRGKKRAHRPLPLGGK